MQVWHLLGREKHGAERRSRDHMTRRGDIKLIWQHPPDLMWEHSPTLPEGFSRPLPYLIEPPSEMASTAAFIRFRDRTLLPMIAADPGDPDLPRFLRCVETVLAWRATIPAEKSFWRLINRCLPEQSEKLVDQHQSHIVSYLF